MASSNTAVLFSSTAGVGAFCHSPLSRKTTQIMFAISLSLSNTSSKFSRMWVSWGHYHIHSFTKYVGEWVSVGSRGRGCLRHHFRSVRVRRALDRRNDLLQWCQSPSNSELPSSATINLPQQQPHVVWTMIPLPTTAETQCCRSNSSWKERFHELF